MALNKPVRRIAIVGTGVIGASWAAEFLAHDFDVVATDPAPNAEQKSQLRHEPPGSVRYLSSASTPSARRSKTPTLALMPFLMDNRRVMSAPSSPSQSAEECHG